MFIAIIFTIVPTFLFYILLDKFIKSAYLKISFSWFCGQYLLTTAIFLLSALLRLAGFNGVLSKALILPLIILVVTGYVVRKQLVLIFSKLQLDHANFIKLALVLITLIFAISFYKPHLDLRGGTIYTSPAYWDFQWHAPLIQNFVYGDNIRPQNESFAGMPSTYHFFWGFWVAIYAATGLDLVLGINYISILSLFFLLVAIIGFGEELFKSLQIGVLALLLTITSSSLHFLNYFLDATNQNLFQVMKNILFNTRHPYFFSFVSGNPFGYN